MRLYASLFLLLGCVAPPPPAAPAPRGPQSEEEFLLLFEMRTVLKREFNIVLKDPVLLPPAIWEEALVPWREASRKRVGIAARLQQMYSKDGATAYPDAAADIVAALTEANNLLSALTKGWLGMVKEYRLTKE